VTLERMRLALYAQLAVAASALLASVALLKRSGVPVGKVALYAIVPSLVLGIIGLAARFPVRALPLRGTSVARLVLTHAASAAAAASVWTLLWSGAAAVITSDTALVFGVGAIIYLGTVMGHYLVMEVEASREAEAAALRYQVLAREAELKAFKAQVDPHFLFNSLNAVASLCGSRPAQAREMAQLMADFFRLTLRIGARDRITLAEEIDLVSRYLAIEQVRFGTRLSTRIDVDERAGEALVPPLLLQPLVENAVRHGIASMVDGGTIAITAAARDGALHVEIENPADPDRSHQKGEGIGLQNARGRLAALCGVLQAREDGGRYIVSIEVPL
jgi:two-component system, LytTR family, sensor histidine kinase AlgZ